MESFKIMANGRSDFVNKAKATPRIVQITGTHSVYLIVSTNLTKNTLANYNGYIVSLDELNLTNILKTWTWLTGEDKTVIGLTKMGGALLKDDDNRLFHLDAGLGELELTSNNYLDFFNGSLDSEVYEIILLPDLVDELENEGKVLGSKQVYTFRKIPLIGGTYDKENINVVDLYEHYSLSGEIHFQLKDLPEGTEVKFKVIE